MTYDERDPLMRVYVVALALERYVQDDQIVTDDHIRNQCWHQWRASDDQPGVQVCTICGASDA